MGEIKQLPQNVANQISAGEVVERPASIVKELIENSIDAGAENIEIRIEEGGRKLIQVKDDGHGILPDDIKAAFNRYATSKIEDIDDLYSLYSLGFRGEALASIASVAEVEMLSRHKEKENGVKIRLKGGEVIKKKPAASTIGTEVKVRDLFYNTPARYKYLKTTSTEFSHISRIVNAEAVANSEISFKLYHNNKQILSTPGNGKLKDCIYALYGADIADNLLKIDLEDRYINLSGYIARPEQTRARRSHELFFANGRPINNSLAAKAVENAYSKLINPGRKPIVFLFIKVNPILVDVNVHPTKKEVKFSRSQIIYDVIAKGVRKTLKEADPTTRIKLNSTQKKQAEQNDSAPVYEKKAFKEEGRLKNISNQKKNKSFNKSSQHRPEELQKNINYSDSNEDLKKQFAENSKKEYLINNDSAKENKFKFLAQIFNSYLLIETAEGLKIIDQHNAHERILYEKLYKEYNEKNTATQSLLIPVKIELSAEEKLLVDEYKESFKELGINFSDFGKNTILIQEVPVLLKNKSTRNIIEELIAELVAEGRTKSAAEIQKTMIEYLACRTAVKAGQPLNNQESLRIIKDLFESENPYRCPHSRPVMINISKDEIEKGIGR